MLRKIIRAVDARQQAEGQGFNFLLGRVASVGAQVSSQASANSQRITSVLISLTESSARDERYEQQTASSSLRGTTHEKMFARKLHDTHVYFLTIVPPGSTNDLTCQLILPPLQPPYVCWSRITTRPWRRCPSLAALTARALLRRRRQRAAAG